MGQLSFAVRRGWREGGGERKAACRRTLCASESVNELHCKGRCNSLRLSHVTIYTREVEIKLRGLVHSGERGATCFFAMCGEEK